MATALAAELCFTQLHRPRCNIPDLDYNERKGENPHLPYAVIYIS